MKIIFIYARIFNKYKDDFFDYSSRIYTKGKVNCTNMPLALPTLAALTPPDIEVKLINENNIGNEEVDFDETADIVGISCVTPAANRAYEIAEKFRERGVYVVMGGFHVSNLPDEAAIYADSVFIGEVEETWPKFIEDFRNNRPRSLYRAERFPDLQNLVIPRWDLVSKDYPVSYVQTTRGCPFKCEFCAVQSFLGKPRQKPIDHVLAEVREIIKHSGSNIIHFADDNIIGNKKYARELFKALIPYNVQWWSPISMNIADDEELMELAKKSGAFAFMIGIESINQASLDSINKGKQNKVDEFFSNIKKVQAKGILVFGLFMVGFDEDDPKVFQNTVDFVEEANIGVGNFSIVTPLPGTVLFERWKNEGRIIHQNWDEYSWYNVCYQPKKMSRETLLQGFIQMVKGIYAYDNLFPRLERMWNEIKPAYVPAEVDNNMAITIQQAKDYYAEMLQAESESIDTNDVMKPYLDRVIAEIKTKDISMISVFSSCLMLTYQYSLINADHGTKGWFN